MIVSQWLDVTSDLSSLNTTKCDTMSSGTLFWYFDKRRVSKDYKVQRYRNRVWHENPKSTNQSLHKLLIKFNLLENILNHFYHHRSKIAWAPRGVSIWGIKPWNCPELSFKIRNRYACSLILREQKEVMICGLLQIISLVCYKIYIE